MDAALRGGLQVSPHYCLLVGVASVTMTACLSIINPQYDDPSFSTDGSISPGSTSGTAGASNTSSTGPSESSGGPGDADGTTVSSGGSGVLDTGSSTSIGSGGSGAETTGGLPSNACCISDPFVVCEDQDVLDCVCPQLPDCCDGGGWQQSCAELVDSECGTCVTQDHDCTCMMQCGDLVEDWDTAACGLDPIQAGQFATAECFDVNPDCFCLTCDCVATGAIGVCG